jgi:predicted amidohydrolase YtcJ
MSVEKKKIYFGGPIITMNDAQPTIDAVGIEGEKILSVGNIDEVKEELGNDYELIDLKGNALLPGFIDSHIHPVGLMLFLVNPDLAHIRSLKELQDFLRNVAKSRDPGEWIFGLSLKEESFDNPVLPTRWDLDDACPDNPVFVVRYDGHIGIANSKALELTNINETTVSPEGGEIRKNEKGDLTGHLSEKAMTLILQNISLPNPQQIFEAAQETYEILASKGITSVQGIVQLGKGGEFGDIGALELSMLKTTLDKVIQNWYFMISVTEPRKVRRIKKPPLHEEGKYARFKVNCVKLFADGTFGSATALMFEPFSDQPDKTGFLVVNEQELYERMKSAHNLGYQLAIHVIGDKGNRFVVDLYKKLLKEFPREDHRHRLEHASMLTADVIKDMKEYGIICSAQPPFINSEYTWLPKRLGEARCKYTYPLKSVVDGGIVFAAGSDCPVEDSDVILGLHALVTRNGFVPEECLSMKEALRAYTIDAAYAAFEEDIKGSIEPGKLADLVILDKNPLEVPNDKIKDIKVVETIIRGKTVYKK